MESERIAEFDDRRNNRKKDKRETYEAMDSSRGTGFEENEDAMQQLGTEKECMKGNCERG